MRSRCAFEVRGSVRTRRSLPKANEESYPITGYRGHGKASNFVHLTVFSFFLAAVSGVSNAAVLHAGLAHEAAERLLVEEGRQSIVILVSR